MRRVAARAPRRGVRRAAGQAARRPAAPWPSPHERLDAVPRRHPPADDGQPERRRLPRRRVLQFRLATPARVSLEVVQTDTATPTRRLDSERHPAPDAAHASARRGRHRVEAAARHAAAHLRASADGPARCTRVRRRRPGALDTPSCAYRASTPASSKPSYAPGEQAAVDRRDRREDAHVPGVRLRRRRVPLDPRPADERAGDDGGRARRLVARTATHPPRSSVVRPGDWPSGLYFLRITAADGRVGYAPFIVRPRTLGSTASPSCSRRRRGRPTTSRTRTATAGATRWYVSGRERSVDLTRPFLDFGLPFRFHDWDLTFLTWLQQTGKQVDFLSDQDLDAIASGDELARNYDLVVFPGHEEYVTQHELDVSRATATSAATSRSSPRTTCSGTCAIDAAADDEGARCGATPGGPEAALVGAQYVGSNHGAVQQPFVVTGADRGAVALRRHRPRRTARPSGATGSRSTRRAPASPPGTIVLARIPDLLGPGQVRRDDLLRDARRARRSSPRARSTSRRRRPQHAGLDDAREPLDTALERSRRNSRREGEHSARCGPESTALNVTERIDALAAALRAAGVSPEQLASPRLALRPPRCTP